MNKSDLLTTRVDMVCPYCGTHDRVNSVDFNCSDDEVISTKECAECGKQWDVVYTYSETETVYRSDDDECECEETETTDWDDRGSLYVMTEECTKCGSEYERVYSYDYEKTSESFEE